MLLHEIKPTYDITATPHDVITLTCSVLHREDLTLLLLPGNRVSNCASVPLKHASPQRLVRGEHEMAILGDAHMVAVPLFTRPGNRGRWITGGWHATSQDLIGESTDGHGSRQS